MASAQKQCSITTFFRKNPATPESPISLSNDTLPAGPATPEPPISLSSDTLTAGGSQHTSWKRSSHRGSYDPHWEIDFSWLRYEPNHDDGPSMFCTICQKYRKSIRKAVWVTIPCQQFRKDKLIEHQRTLSHVGAVSAEASAVSAHCSGGVCAMMEERISINSLTAKCIYILKINSR